MWHQGTTQSWGVQTAGNLVLVVLSDLDKE